MQENTLSPSPSVLSKTIAITVQPQGRLMLTWNAFDKVRNEQSKTVIYKAYPNIQSKSNVIYFKVRQILRKK